MSKKIKVSKSLATQATILAAASIGSKVIGMIYNIPFANLLAEEGNGYYGKAQTVYALILLIATFSIPSAISKIMAERIEKGQYKNVKVILQASFLYVLVVGIIAALVTFFGAPYFVSKSAVLSLQILAPTVFISGFLSVFRGYYQSYGNMVPTSISQIVEQVFNAIFSIAMAVIFMKWAVYLGRPSDRQMFGAAGGTVGTGVACLSGLIYMLIIFRDEKKELAKKIDDEDSDYTVITIKGAIKLLLSIATPIIFSSFIYNANVTIDMKMYEMMMDNAGYTEQYSSALYGIYSRYYLVLANIPIAMAAAVASAVIPKVSASNAVGDNDTCRRTINKSMELTMLLTIPCAMGFAVLGKNIIMMLYPSLSEESVHIAAVLLIIGGVSIMFYGISSVLNAVLQGIGDVNFPVVSASVALIIHAVALYLMLKFADLGIYSLIIATLIYVIIIVFMNYGEIKKKTEFKIDIKKVILPPCLAAFLMGAAAFILYHLLNFIFSQFAGTYIANAVSTIISIGMAALIYFAGIIKFGKYTEDELMAFPKGSLLVRVARKIKLIK